MKTITAPIHRNAAYPLELLLDDNSTLDDILFLDIETTGFTARSSSLYLIGVVYHQEDGWVYTQWLAEQYDEEMQVLTAFFEFAEHFRYLVHYNGNRFDLPYLQQKCVQFDLPYNFDSFTGIDIYRRIAGYKEILGLTDLKQKTIERFIGLDREDVYSGGELISVYHDYACTKDENLLKDLLLHNAEDLEGMLAVCGMLAYPDLFLKPVRVMKVQANYFKDLEKKRSQEIIMKLRFQAPLPRPISFRSLGCYFSGEGLDGSLRVSLFEEEMKYFYSNYKDYYYLPAEDTAIHKSIATFVDKEHRVQATASTCYTRKKSLYLPQWEILFTPFYKREYRSRETYFELTDDFKKSRSGFNMYASHILAAMYENYEE